MEEEEEEEASVTECCKCLGVFESKGQEVIRERRKMHNEQLHI
jgi:hypothetical protein